MAEKVMAGKGLVFYFHETCAVGSHWKRLSETLPMRTHYPRCHDKIKGIITFSR